MDLGQQQVAKVNFHSENECVCLCIRGYYNTILESKDTHATSTDIAVLQSMKEHFMMAHHTARATTIQEVVTARTKTRNTSVSLIVLLA